MSHGLTRIQRRSARRGTTKERAMYRSTRRGRLDRDNRQAWHRVSVTRLPSNREFRVATRTISRRFPFSHSFCIRFEKREIEGERLSRNSVEKEYHGYARWRILNPPPPAVLRCGPADGGESRNPRFATTRTSTRASGEFGAPRFDVTRTKRGSSNRRDARGENPPAESPSGINKLERIYATRRAPMTETDWRSCGRSRRELR